MRGLLGSLAVVAAAVAAHGYEIPAGSTVHYTDIAASLDEATVVNVGAGALFDLDASSVTLKAVTGAGIVSNGTLTLTLAGGPYAYDGQFRGGTGMNLRFSRPAEATDDEFGLVIGDSLALDKCVIKEPDAAGHVLRFSTAATTYYCQGYLCSYASYGHKLVLADTAGKPITFITGISTGRNPAPDYSCDCWNLRAEGPGSILFRNTYSTKYDLRADMVSGVKGTVGLYSGSVSEIDSNFVYPNAAKFQLGPGSATFTTAKESDLFRERVRIVGSGGYSICRPTILEDFWLAGGTLWPCSGATTVLTNYSRTGVSLVYPGVNTTFVMDGNVRLSPTGNPTSPSLLRSLTGVYSCNGVDGSTLTLRNGAECWFSRYGMKVANLEKGGKFCLVGDIRTTAVNGDGGALVLGQGTSGWSFFGDGSTLSVKAGGLILEGHPLMNESASGTPAAWFCFYINRAIANGIEGAADGGFTLRHLMGQTLQNCPSTINGPCAINDTRYGVMLTRDDFSTLTTSPFGSGDLSLGATELCLVNTTAGRTIHLADGANAKLRLTGSGSIVLEGLSAIDSRTGVAQNIVIGPSDAADYSAITREKGGVLFLRTMTDNATIDGSGSTVKVNGGVQVHAGTKVPLLPIFAIRSPKAEVGSNWGGWLDFTTYDATDGFRTMTDYATDFEQGTDSIVKVTSSKTVSADAHIGGLCVQRSVGVTVPSGVTLTVGDGSNPAAILLSSSGDTSGASVLGAGTVDFGTSEGIIGQFHADSSGNKVRVTAKVSGQNGLTVVGMYQWKGSRFIHTQLDGDNDFTGGLRVRNAAISVGHEHALGCGAVHLFGARQNGAGLMFDRVDGLTVTNDIALSGYGCYDYRGALYFSTATTHLTGNLTFEGQTRLRSSSGCTAYFDGVLSGEGPVCFHAGGGTFVLTQPAAYTGNTDIVRQTVVLKGKGALPTTGFVTIDGGTLRCENSVPLTLGRFLDGVGTVQLASKKAVTVTDYVESEYTQLTLDVAGDGKRRVINSLKSFASVANSTGVATTLVVRDGSRPSGAVDPSVTIVDGFSGFAVLVR